VRDAPPIGLPAVRRRQLPAPAPLNQAGPGGDLGRGPLAVAQGALAVPEVLNAPAEIAVDVAANSDLRNLEAHHV